jgi:uncharacterized protein YggE
MNKKWLWLAGLVALVVPAVALAGCTGDTTEGQIAGSPVEINLNNQQEGIWVNGEGEVTAIPDIANISLGIEAQAATVTEARTEAATAMEEVIKALTDKGVADKDIRTQYFNISKVTRWDDETRQEVVIGYRVTNTVDVKIREIDEAGSIIDAVALAGGDLTRVNGISFTIDDPTVYQREARDKAMADAKGRAEQLATLAGVTLGKPIYISESYYYPRGTSYKGISAVDMEEAAPMTPISPGEMEITLSVQVVYAILD